jgi:hypothetical protein
VGATGIEPVTPSMSRLTLLLVVERVLKNVNNSSWLANANLWRPAPQAFSGHAHWDQFGTRLRPPVPPIPLDFAHNSETAPLIWRGAIYPGAARSD